MKYTKQIFIIVAVLVVGAGLTAWSGAQASTVDLFRGTLNEQVIFANTYISVGAALDGQTVNGNILANQAITIGAGAKIDGNLQSGAAVTTGDSTIITDDILSGAASTIGANSVVSGNLRSGAAVTLGANSQVTGTVVYNNAVTNGAGATSGTQTQDVSSPVIPDEHQRVIVAQSALDAMFGEVLIAGSEITTDTTFVAGVYDIPGYLTTAAGVTLTLDAQGQDSAFIFNMSTYMTLGAGTILKVINGTPNTTVIWNVTNGYASIGANVDMVGTILAEQYIIIGAGATVTGSGDSCGGIFSGRSYVTVGANVSIGAHNCTGGVVANMSMTDGLAHYEVGTSPGPTPPGPGPTPGPGPSPSNI